MSWNGYPKYVPVAERRAKAEKEIARLKKQGRTVLPVSVQGRMIARSFWGEAWCANLEAYSDYSSRLPRGRTYARNGSILDLQIEEGRVDALIQGSRCYEVSVRIDPLPEGRWSAIREACAGQIDSLVDLLRGQLSDGVMGVVTRARTGLFPSPDEIHLDCSCPDWATMCKHVAAALYGVGNRLDHAPEMLFTLRGVDPSAMVEEALERGAGPRRRAPGRALDVDDLSAVFGVAIDFGGGAPLPERRGAAAASKPRPPSETDAQGGLDLPARARQVLEVIAENPDLRTPALAQRLGVSRSTVSSAIALLRAEGLIVFVGAPRSGGYRCTQA